MRGKNRLWGITTILIAMVISTSRLHSQVFVNESDKELMYLNIRDSDGHIHSQMFFSKGKAYFQEGKSFYGTGKQRLKNIDGKGQPIGIVPSTLQHILMEKCWLLTIRVDEMQFHWAIDERLEMAIIVDALTIHDKKVETIVSAGMKPEPKIEQEVEATGIAFNDHENRVVIKGVANVPYAAGRTCIFDLKAAATNEGKPPEAKQPAAPKETELVIKEDGTLTAQDVLVHLTSPLVGEPETLLRNVTITNQFKNGLMLLEIRGMGGVRTGIVYCDKGQSMTFDARGFPISGQGKFKVEAVGKDKSQIVAGWLDYAGSARSGKKFESATLEFLQTPKDGTQPQLTDFVEAAAKPEGPTTQPTTAPAASGQAVPTSQAAGE